MMADFIPLVLVVFAVIVAAGATPSPQPQMRVHERLTAPPEGYIAVGKADAHTPLILHLALTPRDENGLISKLYSVSDPDGNEYGKHLSNDQIASFMAPTPEAASAVNTWLATNGVDSEVVSPAGDWIKLTTTVAKANALFNANFTVFDRQASGTRIVRTLQYSLPAVLQPHIDLLFPGISFGGPHSQPRLNMAMPPPVKGAAVPARCVTVITPDCLQALYGIPTAPATQASNSLAVSGFIDQYANRADLQQFLRRYRPDIANNTFIEHFLDGGINPQGISQAGLEANLDIQYTVGLATDVPVYFISVGPDNSDSLGGWLDLALYLLALPNPPQVLTTSYGWNERDLSPLLLNRLCTTYAALGLRGTSLLFSTGDFGVSGLRQGQSCDTFIPTAPSTCPYVTAVGATSQIPQTAADFSSGGFSNLFPRPLYQSTAVNAYLARIGGLYAGRFNPAGRAFPDVAAMGENVLIVLRGQETFVYGTSASTPIFASIIALINDRRAALGLPSLGFLNPFLYANPQAFHDITTGSNPGCGTNGFPAVPGWDPVTGLGTPIFDALAAAAGV